jgi:hypothetical protein
MKSSQGFAHGTYREQDMEQSAMAAELLAAPRNRLSQTSVASGYLSGIRVRIEVV